MLYEQRSLMLKRVRFASHKLNKRTRGLDAVPPSSYPEKRKLFCFFAILNMIAIRLQLKKPLINNSSTKQLISFALY